MRRLAYLGALVFSVGAGAMFAASRGLVEFPHEKHASLGVSCEGCHAGIYSGNEAQYVSVRPESCAGCHNGQAVREIDWEGYTPAASGLVFDHPLHRGSGCQTCHNAPRSDGDMAVQPASASACAMCHTDMPEHASGFLAQHGDAAVAQFETCTECHQETTCTTCHDGPRDPNNKFKHSAHPAIGCVTCHGGAEGGAQFQAASAEKCLACHGNGATEHLQIGVNPCETCHVEAAPGHTDDWPTQHGAAAATEFGTCTQCHQETTCTTCHDGPRDPNNKFKHSAHPAIGCQTCHGVPGDEEGMAFQAASAEKCLACHGNGATEHMQIGVSPCETCHVNAAPGHTPDFATQHGPAATEQFTTCTQCHQETTCTACHDGSRDSNNKFRHSAHPAIGCVTCHRDPEGASDGSFKAADADNCVACHGNGATDHFEVGINPCTTCHFDPRPGHTPDWKTQHATAAAAELPQCSQCHKETFCVDCHDGPKNPGFAYHPANFVTRHAAESWAAPMECSECHSREVFCRDCHSNQGVAQDGRQNGGYHDGVSNWLQQHGAAARQGMESCTTCHQQTSCLACHSAKQGWRVNPHGPDFDPTRAADRSTQSCAICHTGY